MINIKLSYNTALLFYSREDYERSMEYVNKQTAWKPKLYGFQTKNWVIGIVRG
nr:MAG: hypothetical protein [Caudoviricetes sp.]